MTTPVTKKIESRSDKVAAGFDPDTAWGVPNEGIADEAELEKARTYFAAKAQEILDKAKAK